MRIVTATASNAEIEHIFEHPLQSNVTCNDFLAVPFEHQTAAVRACYEAGKALLELREANIPFSGEIAVQLKYSGVAFDGSINVINEADFMRMNRRLGRVKRKISLVVDKLPEGITAYLRIENEMRTFTVKTSKKRRN
jgi:hypothetical protein